MPRPTQNRTATQRLQALYVRILLRLLPLLLAGARLCSESIRAEVDYLRPCTFMLDVSGTSLSCTCRITEAGSFKRVPPTHVARDVEPGSGMASSDTQAVTVDYVIAFRSLAYAFHCFSGGMSLQSALAQRAFATRGPNNQGVALTYMFTALLRMFFGWRATYRKPKAAAALRSIKP